MTKVIRRSRPVIVCVIVLSICNFAARPALAVSDIILTPNQGPPGQEVTATGTGSPGEEVTITGFGVTLATTTVDSDEHFVAVFRVPESTQQGTYQLVFAPTDSGGRVADFTVTQRVDPPPVDDPVDPPPVNDPPVDDPPVPLPVPTPTPSERPIQQVPRSGSGPELDLEQLRDLTDATECVAAILAGSKAGPYGTLIAIGSPPCLETILAGGLQGIALVQCLERFSLQICLNPFVDQDRAEASEVAEQPAPEQPVSEVAEQPAPEQPVSEVAEQPAPEQPVSEVAEHVSEVAEQVSEVAEQVSEWVEQPAPEQPVSEVAEQVSEWVEQPAPEQPVDVNEMIDTILQQEVGLDLSL